jgi:hypothetical protein
MIKNIANPTVIYVIKDVINIVLQAEEDVYKDVLMNILIA